MSPTTGDRAAGGPGRRLPALIVAAAFVAVFFHVAYVPARAIWDAPLTLPWWLLAAGFLVADLTIVHLQTERDAHTITLSEIPLVLGLAFASPTALLIGRIAGSAIALGAVRRQEPVKLAFNLTSAYLETVTVIAVAGAVAGSSGIQEPRGWVATLVAVALGATVTATLVALVMSMHDPAQAFHRVLRSLTAGTVVNLGTATVAIAATVAIWHDTWAALLFAGMAALFFFGIRVYGSLARRHDDLRAVHAFTRELSGRLDVDDIVVTAAGHTRQELRAGVAEIAVLDPDGARVLRVDARGERSAERLTTGEAAALVAGCNGNHPVFVLPGTPLSRRFGTAHAEQAMISPLQVGGERAGYVAVAHRLGPVGRFDVHDLDLMETLMQYLAATLEGGHAVARLEAEVDEKRRVIASKDQLIAAVSHELRTPLTGLLGYAEILGEESADPDEKRQMIEFIAGEAFELSSIVEDLLTAARVDQGRLTVTMAEVDLEALARRFVDEWHHRTRRPVEMVFRPALAAGDEQRVRQILRNLLDNAARYGGPSVRVVTGAAGDQAVLEVWDDGPGIPPAERDRVFEPYHSAHAPGTQPGSVGLGLSICRSLAGLMGGILEYRREDGWSVFRLGLDAVTETSQGTAPGARLVS